MVKQSRDGIKNVYNITDLGDLQCFLGMEIKCDHTECTISMNQKVYIKGIVTKFGLTTAKSIYIPMLPGELLTHEQPSTPAQHAEMLKIPYGNMIGHVLWLVMIS